MLVCKFVLVYNMHISVCKIYHGIDFIASVQLKLCMHCLLPLQGHNIVFAGIIFITFLETYSYYDFHISYQRHRIGHL